MDDSVDYQATIDAALAGIVGEEFKFKDTMFTSVIMIMDAEYESVFNFLAEVLEPLLKRQADEFTTDL